MKANELRYGNKLMFLGEVVTFESISEIRKDGIFWIKTKEVIESKSFHFKPIPLTEEWLLKFGVEKNSFNHFLLKLPISINFKLILHIVEDYIYIRQGDFDCDDEMITIWNKDLTKRDIYVHEFQNLYFALTNEELTLI